MLTLRAMVLSGKASLRLSPREPGDGQQRLQPIGGLKAAQIWLGKPVGSWRRAPVAAGLALP